MVFTWSIELVLTGYHTNFFYVFQKVILCLGYFACEIKDDIGYCSAVLMKRYLIEKFHNQMLANHDFRHIFQGSDHRVSDQEEKGCVCNLTGFYFYLSNQAY